MDRARLHRSGGATAERERDDVPASVPAAPVPLRVGAADDRAEVEADRRADQVLARLAGETEAHAHGPGCDHGHAVRRSPAAGGSIGLAGGALDADTDSRITSRLGAGRTLDAGVRRDMEGAFGRSFSGVRVHADGEADQLNRQLSSTAFTVGSDVFFRGGAYRPDDRSGQRLLAHELAHVEQDGGGAHRTVHRAVGFEFETPLIVKKRLPDNTFEKYKKATVLKDFGGLKMETDEHSAFGSVIEWVIDPPVSETERKKLVKILELLDKDVHKIIGAYDKARDEPVHLGTKNHHTAPTTALSATGIAGVDADAWVLPDRYVPANPQVTGGISFAKVIDMMSEMGSSGDTSGVDKKLKTGAQNLQKAAVSGITPPQAATLVKAGGAPTGIVTPSKELQSLAAMLVVYLKAGATGGLLDYPKLISDSMLIRTDFGTLFNRLPTPEVRHLEQNPQHFVSWILTIASLNGDERVIERGIRKSYDRNSPDYNTRDDDDGLQYLRKEWLTAICGGHDLMSAKTNPAMSDKFEGLGRLGNKFDAVGKEAKKKPDKQVKDGVIMEFRNMSKGAMEDKWTALALGIFDYLKDRNNR